MKKESKKRPEIKVLMYHRVIDSAPNDPVQMHYVTTDDFRSQMQIIEWFGYTPITFIDYKLYREGKLSLPAKPIIITFDDGYLDTYEKAVPIMINHNMRGVVFAMGDRSIRRASWDQKQHDCETYELMDDNQLRELRKLGFEIGAHTMSHENLLDLNLDDASYQIKCSKQQIEEVLNEEVYSFAYPYGAVDKRVQSIVEKAGFAYACGVYSGSPRFDESVLDFRRLAVDQRTPLYKFLIKLLTPYQYLEWSYHTLKKKQVLPERHVNKRMITEVS